MNHKNIGTCFDFELDLSSTAIEYSNLNMPNRSVGSHVLGSNHTESKLTFERLSFKFLDYSNTSNPIFAAVYSPHTPAQAGAAIVSGSSKYTEPLISVDARSKSVE